MKHVAKAGGIVISKSGKVLVVSQKGNSWSLPKGHIDEGESAKQAASREIKEESSVTDLKLVKELEPYRRSSLTDDGRIDSSEESTITLFIYVTNQDTLKPTDPENPEARWVDLDKVSELLTHPRDKVFFEQQKELILNVIKLHTE